MLKKVKFRWNLTARLVCATAIIGIFATLTFSLLINDRLKRNFENQKVAVSELARSRISEQLEVKIEHLASHMDSLVVRTKDAGYTIAVNQPLRSALMTGNSVRVHSLLNKIVETSDFNAILALDPNLDVIVSHETPIPGEKLRQSVASFPMIPRLRGIVLANNSNDPYAYTGFNMGSEEYLRSSGIDVSDDHLTIVSMHPVFDDNGKLLAVLLGHRLITSKDTAFVASARTNDLELQIFEGQKVLLSANLTHRDYRIPVANNSSFGLTASGSHLYRCQRFLANWRICTYKPVAELDALINRLVEPVKEANKDLFDWFKVLFAATLVLGIASAWASASRILSPLVEMARSVRSVAKGNWLVSVSGLNRQDEVGEIARAIAVLQDSMKERERLRADMVGIEQERARCEELECAIYSHQSSLRNSLFILSDIAETLDVENKRLSGLASLAVGETDETRLVTCRALNSQIEQKTKTALKTKESSRIVIESIDRISVTVGSMETGAHEVSEDLNRLLQETQNIDRTVKKLLDSVHLEPEIKVSYPTEDERREAA